MQQRAVIFSLHENGRGAIPRNDYVDNALPARLHGVVPC
jgi:hypothetical protein